MYNLYNACLVYDYERKTLKTLNLSRNIVSLQVLVDGVPFFTLRDQLVAQQIHLLRVVAERRKGVNFEQQILALLLVFHQTHNLARNKFARAQATQPIRALHFFDPQQMFLLRIKLIMRGEKRETSTTTCNETMLRDKLKVFVSRISSPLETTADYTRYTLAQKLKRWVLVNSRIKSFGSNRNIGSVIMKYLACTHSLFLKIGIFL